jgi:hypothetical protein
VAFAASPASPDVTAVAKAHFGKAQPYNSGEAALPRYVSADFNGDGVPDLAFPLTGDEAMKALAGSAVTAVPLYNRTTIPEIIGRNCFGLGLVNGSAAPTGPVSSHLLYECFSGFALAKRASPLVRKAVPKAAGDCLLLDLETGGQSLLCWVNGHYEVTYTRNGD